jgi:hypothetical protein
LPIRGPSARAQPSEESNDLSSGDRTEDSASGAQRDREASLKWGCAVVPGEHDHEQINAGEREVA